MEYVSKFYCRTNKSDLMYYVQRGIYHPEAVYELLAYIDSYEKENGVEVGDFHINACSTYVRSLLNLIDNPIKQQSVINAYLQALVLGDDEIAEKLIPFMSIKAMEQATLGCPLFNYVLSHCSDLDELFEGEKKKLIFDDKSHQFVMGYLSDFYVDVKKLTKKAN